MNDVVCKEVIITNLLCRGKGIKSSPIRRVVQVFEKDGTLIAENDPSPETFSAIDMIRFARWIMDGGFDSSKTGVEMVDSWLNTFP
jgi:hypothetical protein